MIIVSRIKHEGRLIGYIADNNEFIGIQDIDKYTPENVIMLKNKTWKAKNGYCIETIDKNELTLNIENRNTKIVGKPNLLYNYDFAKMSKTQRIVLEKLKEIGKDKLLFIDKKKYNIKINMKDLSALTAYTGVEFTLFERPDRYAVAMGTARGIYLANSDIASLSNGNYQWVGHTHPGRGFNCLMPSDGDYETLSKFNQTKSSIFNSVGEYYIFGEENSI